ncbi:MAG: hypothetical protein NZ898_02860 [Myxococcota bacterium]|nr:hypothetical protein [Myxococcota bacterium]MDW8361314.1 hypothetical protein [Myxococcales bacterium]
MRPAASTATRLATIMWLSVGSATGAQAQRRLPYGLDAWTAMGAPAIRGVTLGPIESSQQPDRGYGTEQSARTLDHLVALGANWVSITPFGRIASLSDTHVAMDFEAPYERNRLAVRRVVEQARARGLRVLVVPHLWVEQGGWRGHIDPGSPERWARFHESYRRFVLAWASDAAAAGADAFSIGVECASWSGRFGGVWRTLIEQVRARFAGLLTYSANWDEAEHVLFWDLLDVVGINAFHPLADRSGASDADYFAGAERNARAVGDLARTLQMPVLFVEVGYTSRPDAAVEPWLWPDDIVGVPVDEIEQSRALEATFAAFVPQPWFVGFFVWRYYATLHDVSQEAPWGFSPHGKLAERALRVAFDGRFGVEPEPWPWIVTAHAP